MHQLFFFFFFAIFVVPLLFELFKPFIFIFCFLLVILLETSALQSHVRELFFFSTVAASGIPTEGATRDAILFGSLSRRVGLCFPQRACAPCVLRRRSDQKKKKKRDHTSKQINKQKFGVASAAEGSLPLTGKPACILTR